MDGARDCYTEEISQKEKTNVIIDAHAGKF